MKNVLTCYHILSCCHGYHILLYHLYLLKEKKSILKKNPHANKVKLMQVNSVHYQKHTKISKIAK